MTNILDKFQKLFFHFIRDSRTQLLSISCLRSPFKIKSNFRNTSCIFKIILILLIVIASSLTANADNKKLPLPRFASIKSNEVNARSGPTTKSLIEWVFVKKGEPVEIIAEHEQWRQVRDIDGDGGWTHSSVLTGKRSVIIIGNKEVELTRASNPNSKVIAKLMPNIRCFLNKCKENYCQIRCKDYLGWVSKKVIWGVYNDDKAY